MWKKIFVFLIFLGSMSFSNYALGNNIEDVFGDITTDYPYYQSLQYLYNNGVITPNSQGNFAPNEYLNRDEFVGISMHTMCRECMSPNVSVDLLQQYSTTQPFFDVLRENKYFYCIADATQNNFVAGYNSGHICQNGSQTLGERPFCIENKITLEEALAVLLRNANIFTQQQNQQTLSQIRDGTITQSLAGDVHPLTSDGEAYTFYGYIQKALSYEIVDYDLEGNATKYFLVSKDEDGNISPKQYITKEQFLKMAYIIHKTNACSIQSGGPDAQNSIATQLIIYPPACTKDDSTCDSDDVVPGGSTYDYESDFVTQCSEGIRSVDWVFLNTSNNETFSQTGEYLDDIELPSYGNWKIVSRVQDMCGQVSESIAYISYQPPEQSSLGVQIIADPIYGIGPLNVDFESIVWGCQNCTYEWNFGDGNTSQQKNPTHIYPQAGTYEVELQITDENGNTSFAQIVIRVDAPNEENIPERDPTRDTDGDGVPDILDRCPLIAGEASNMGCPVLSRECLVNSENTCGEGYECAQNGICEPIRKNTQVCIIPPSGSSIFGNVSCNSCPCNYEVDFLATLRKCDVLFPAIVSPDGSELFSRGDVYQIPYK